VRVLEHSAVLCAAALCAAALSCMHDYTMICMPSMQQQCCCCWATHLMHVGSCARFARTTVAACNTHKVPCLPASTSQMLSAQSILFNQSTKLMTSCLPAPCPLQLITNSKFLQQFIAAGSLSEGATRTLTITLPLLKALCKRLLPDGQWAMLALDIDRACQEQLWQARVSASELELFNDAFATTTAASAEHLDEGLDEMELVAAAETAAAAAVASIPPLPPPPPPPSLSHSLTPSLSPLPLPLPLIDSTTALMPPPPPPQPPLPLNTNTTGEQSV
jgi:hypothetical protein